MRSSIITPCIITPCVAALLLFPSATTVDAETFVLRYDAIASTGGYVSGTLGGGMLLGMTVGQPVIGRATSAAWGDITETVGFWHPRGSKLVGVDDPAAQLGLAFALMPISPNPSVRNARIRYVIPGPAGAGIEASVRLFDVSGRLVRVLASGPHTPGTHTVTWDGRNSAGAQLGAGVFFVELAAGPFRGVRRVTLLR